MRAPDCPHMAAQSPYPLPPRERTLIALRADCDVRSVEKYLGTVEVLRPRLAARIEHAIRDLGYHHVLRANRLPLAS
jgi:hypothetical protein